MKGMRKMEKDETSEVEDVFEAKDEATKEALHSTDADEWISLYRGDLRKLKVDLERAQERVREALRTQCRLERIHAMLTAVVEE